MADVLADIARIKGLDEQIDDLKDQREEVTYRLEKAAMVYHRSHPREGKLDCSRCTFTYSAAADGKVEFTTDCSWCGPQDHYGIKIAVDRLAEIIEAEGEK
ncbi:hypothetical protein [Streptomyces sp. NPDC058252]|uniref:hypothetical protein n=1 Tax=Streptomyces sp. NPDC058252 TaxID=3346405 RepID=UPI0036E957BF